MESRARVGAWRNTCPTWAGLALRSPFWGRRAAGLATAAGSAETAHNDTTHGERLAVSGRHFSPGRVFCRPSLAAPWLEGGPLISFGLKINKGPLHAPPRSQGAEYSLGGGRWRQQRR